MRQTTVLIRSTTEEGSRVRVYWRWAVSSKSWSGARGLRAFSRVARTMTLTGASWANCSKTSPRSMGVASPESGYLQVERQVSRNIGPPIQGWVERVELGNPRVVDAGGLGGVRAELDRDELAVFEAGPAHQRQRPRLVADVDPEAAVRGEFQDGRLDLGLLQGGQRATFAAVDELGVVEQVDVLGRLLP